MRRAMTLAVERIADDPRFAARFRRDPYRALRRYRLTREQVEAIKSGDARSLARHGVDVAAFARGRRHGMRPRVRRVAALVGSVGVIFGLRASPAVARAGGTAPSVPDPDHGLVISSTRDDGLNVMGQVSRIDFGLKTGLEADPSMRLQNVGFPRSDLRDGLDAIGIDLEYDASGDGPVELGSS